MILACGHFKQTQQNYIEAALINIIISIITVKVWGLIGVAIGTLVAMSFQTVWMANYNSKNFIHWPLKMSFKQTLIDMIIVVLSLIFSRLFEFEVTNYISWIFLAIKICLMVLIISLFTNIAFYLQNMEKIFKRIKIIF